MDRADDQAQQVRIDETEPATTVESGPAAATSATAAGLAFAGRDRDRRLRTR